MITFNIEGLSREDEAMLQRVLGPVVNALVEAIKPELEALTNQINQANAIRDQKAKDYETVNERRIVLENANASLVADKARLNDEIITAKLEVEAAKAETKKWEDEATKLIADTDATIAKIKAERDEARTERDRVAQKLGALATRLHDTMLFLGNN